MDSHDGLKKLSDDELMKVTGGDGEPQAPNKPLPRCPNCGTDGSEVVLSGWSSEDNAHLYLDLFCRKCKTEWTVRYY